MQRLSLQNRLFLLLLAIAASPFLALTLLDLAPAQALLGIPVAALLLYPVALALIRPQVELLELVQRIRSGDLRARAVLRAGTEPALIADALSDLAERLDAVTRGLDEQVAARTATLARKADQLRAVGQVGQQVASALEPEGLLHFVTRVMRGTFGYDLVAVLQKHGDHLVLTACAARGTDEVPLGRVFPLTGPQAPALAQALQGRAAEGVAALGGAVSPLLPGLAPRAEMAIPIRLGDRVLGVMVVQSLSPTPFDSEDRFTGRTIAGQVAVALENARLLEAERQLRDLAVTEERNRMAREIHDTLAQGFMGIIMQLRAMQAATDEETARFHRETAEALARESLQEARRSVWNLRPQPLEGRGLAGALADEVASLERRAALHGQFETEGDVESLPAPIEAALLRIAQEALHNAVKYARASHIVVRLAATASEIHLSIADDGVGFDPANLAPKGEGGGYGLGAMAERARLLGGELILDTAPGAGCRLVARLPIRGSASR